MYPQDQCVFVSMQFQVISFSGHQHFYCLAGCRSFWLVMSCLGTVKLGCLKEYTCSCMEEVLINQYCMIFFFFFCFFSSSLSLALSASCLLGTNLLLFNLSRLHGLWQSKAMQFHLSDAISYKSYWHS